MAAKIHRRNYVRRHGLTEAAAELGCTYSHLRRVVLGERKTPLLDRYHALLRLQGADPADLVPKPNFHPKSDRWINQNQNKKVNV